MFGSILVTLLVLMGTVSMAGQPMAATDRLEANKQVVLGYMEAIDNPDYSGWEQHFTETITFNGRPRPPQSMTGILTVFRQGFPDLEFNIMGQIAEGDRVATWGFFEGTHTGEFQGIPPTGRRVKWFGMGIDRIENGKVAELWHEMDVHGLMRQLQAEE